MATGTDRGSKAFLTVAGAMGLAVIGIPLFLSPLRWARVLQWRIPDDTDLTTYFGRTLGAAMVALSAGGLKAARRPEEYRIVFEITFLGSLLATVAHVWGALLRRQPWTETAEIALWSAMTAGALLAYPREQAAESQSDSI